MTDLDPVSDHSSWPYGPSKAVLDAASRRFFGADPGEHMAVSLEAAVAAAIAVLRAELSGVLLGDPAMTNAEMAAIEQIRDDPEHEGCGPIYMGYAARIVREAPYGD